MTQIVIWRKLSFYRQHIQIEVLSALDNIFVPKSLKLSNCKTCNLSHHIPFYSEQIINTGMFFAYKDYGDYSILFYRCSYNWRK